MAPPAPVLRRSTREEAALERLNPTVDSSCLDDAIGSESSPSASTLAEHELEDDATYVAQAPEEADEDCDNQRSSRKKSLSQQTKKAPARKQAKKSKTATGRVTKRKVTTKAQKSTAAASKTAKGKTPANLELRGTKNEETKPIASPTKAASVKPLLHTIRKKPEAIGKPEVWAESRQGLCETVPYYRSFQGGAYCLEGVCYGFLLAYDGTSRLHFDDQVVITRASGGQAIDPKTGKMVQIRDHGLDSANVQAMYRTRDMKLPVVLIAGDDNVNIPTKMPHPYNVLGYFQITDIWPEENQGCVCYKYRFEKIDLVTQSWWAADPELIQPDYSIKAKVEKCEYCGQSSPQVVQKWFCLNQSCDRFWKHAITRASPADTLGYDSDFLNKRTPWPKEICPPFQLRPEFFPADRDASVLAYTLSGWRGICCPKCGCCSARVWWNRVVCSARGCDFVHDLSQPIICAQSAARKPFHRYDGHAVSQDVWDEKFITVHKESFIGNYRISEYHLPLPGNFVYHFQANKKIQKAPNGPDELFIELQKQHFGLKRHVNGSRTDKGAQLSRHFAVNFGMPYKYILAVDSNPFEGAPVPIVSALQRCRWAGQQVGQTQEGEFNEVLAVGYFETGKMGYHDDGEKELGPTVATLGLGGPASMTLRMKEKHWNGYTTSLSKGKLFDPDAEIIPNSYLEEERRKLKLEVETGLSREDAQKKFDKLLKKTDKKKSANCPAFLKMRFLHGDIIIMQGAEVQKYFEHEIKFDGDLRFALTCRHVKWDLYPPKEHEKAKFDAEKFPPYDGAKEGVPESATAVAAAPDEDMEVDENLGFCGGFMRGVQTFGECSGPI